MTRMASPRHYYPMTPTEFGRSLAAAYHEHQDGLDRVAYFDEAARAMPSEERREAFVAFTVRCLFLAEDLAGNDLKPVAGEILC